MEAILAPYELEMTATDDPRGGDHPEHRGRGVDAVDRRRRRRRRRPAPRRPGARSARRRFAPTDRPGLAAMGMTRPQQARRLDRRGHGRDRRRRARRAAGRLGGERPVPPWRGRPRRARPRAALGRPSAGWPAPLITFIAASVMVVLLAVGGVAAPSRRTRAGRPAQPPAERAAGDVARRLLRR